MNWTEEQVNSLAPDPASLKAGKGLAVPVKWQNLGVSDNALWGECQGSGSNPYKTQVDFREIAFKCTCPSRKFPCKHSLGILFLLVNKKELFPSSAPPGWVEEWLLSRQAKKEKQVEKQKTVKEADPEKKAKTEAKRMQSVEEGVTELELWLKDMARKGINQLQASSYSYFKNISARMVDCKAPVLAKKTEELAGIPHAGENWPERFLEKISSVYLLIQGFRNSDRLSEENQHDIKSSIGWTYSQEELLKNTGINDKWLVISQSFEEENNLKTRKSYLLGSETGKFAMLLDYAFGAKPFDNLEITAGKILSADLVYYPGSYPVRGLLKEIIVKPEAIDSLTVSKGFHSLEQVYAEYSAALASNPFIENIPMLLRQVVPAIHEEQLLLSDSDKYILKVRKGFLFTWLLLALSGGRPVEVFGEWDGKSFLPLSVIIEDDLYSFA